MSTFGIPYAAANDDGSVTCPVCGARIVPTERKDFESFTGREYAEHYAAEHTCPHGHPERSCWTCYPLTADEVGLDRPHIPGTDYYDGRDGSIEADDNDEDRIADQDAHEGDPAWNGAFDRW